MRLATLVLALCLATPLHGAAESLKVAVDQAARLRLAAPVHDIMIGNPAIADVTVMDARHLMVIGKGFGVTNLMVTDGAGRVIFNRQVVVGAPDANHVSLYRGPVVTEYACSPRCQRSGGAAPATAIPQ